MLPRGLADFYGYRGLEIDPLSTERVSPSARGGPVHALVNLVSRHAVRCRRLCPSWGYLERLF